MHEFRSSIKMKKEKPAWNAFVILIFLLMKREWFVDQMRLPSAGKSHPQSIWLPRPLNLIPVSPWPLLQDPPAATCRRRSSEAWSASLPVVAAASWGNRRRTERHGRPPHAITAAVSSSSWFRYLNWMNLNWFQFRFYFIFAKFISFGGRRPQISSAYLTASFSCCSETKQILPGKALDLAYLQVCSAMASSSTSSRRRHMRALIASSSSSFFLFFLFGTEEEP